MPPTRSAACFLFFLLEGIHIFSRGGKGGEGGPVKGAEKAPNPTKSGYVVGRPTRSLVVKAALPGPSVGSNLGLTLERQYAFSDRGIPPWVIGTVLLQ